MNTPSFRASPFVSALLAIPIVLTSQSACAVHAQAHVDSENPAQLIYLDKSANPAIASYKNVQGAEVPALAPQIVYADQAHGQAIYSYAHAGAFTSRPFNAEYVDTAFGQAIYSYPSAGATTGIVNVLDILPLPSAP
jgi:hypothetical protein